MRHRHPRPRHRRDRARTRPTPCVLATGGYGNVFFLSTNAMDCNVTAAWRAHQQGRAASPTRATRRSTRPASRRATSSSRSSRSCRSRCATTAASGCRRSSTTPGPPDQIPEDDRDYFLERRYPAFGNLVPRDVASRNAKTRGRRGPRRRPAEERRVPRLRATPSSRLGEDVIEERYGNLFEMYERITDENPYKVPMRIYPAIHYTMGGLWVDYNLMTNVPGLYALGEANFSDHGANRLGASALMQGLADGYFVLPYTIGDYLAGAARHSAGAAPTTPRSRRPRRRVDDAGQRCCRSRAPARSTTSTASSARSCGTTAAWPATSRRSRRPSREIPALREEFREGRAGARRRPTASTSRSRRPGGSPTSSSSAELMCRDALHREESLRRPLPGRVPDRGRRGAARRRALRLRRAPGSGPATGDARRSTRSRSTFENVQLAQRSYK